MIQFLATLAIIMVLLPIGPGFMLMLGRKWRGEHLRK